MRGKMIILAGVAWATHGALAVERPTGYLRLFGPSPLHLAVVAAPKPDLAAARALLPALARGNEVNQPPTPHSLPLPGSVFNRQETAGSGSTGNELEFYGPEPPTSLANGSGTVIGGANDPDDQPPPPPGTHAAPASPSILMPFFVPNANRNPGSPQVVVPVQFTPAVPPPDPRSSRAIYTKQ